MLNLTSDSPLAGAIPIDEEQFPVFARHELEGDATPVARERGSVNPLSTSANESW